MADIMIDNWTLQRAAISINDTYEKISSPNEEYVKLIEALVLWDHVYFIDNEYSSRLKKLGLFMGVSAGSKRELSAI